MGARDNPDTSPWGPGWSPFSRTSGTRGLRTLKVLGAKGRAFQRGIRKLLEPVMGMWGVGGVGGYRGKEFRIQENEDPGDLDMHLVLLLTSYMRMVVKSFNIFKSQFPHLRKGPKTFWH